MYLAFLGLVVLVLVSVFIAQANGCYNDVKDIADQMANYSCARLLTQTSTMLPVWLFNAIGVNIYILICDYSKNVCCYISVYIDEYSLCIGAIFLTFYYLYYHPPFYHNRKGANLLKFHLMCGRIGHVIALVTLRQISCEVFGK